MALPSSGQLSMNQIRTELGVQTQAPFSLYSAQIGSYVTINPCSTSKPSSSTPANISKWYGYNQSASCLTQVSLYIYIDPYGGVFLGDLSQPVPFSINVYNLLATAYNTQTCTSINGGGRGGFYIAPYSYYGFGDADSNIDTNTFQSTQMSNQGTIYIEEYNIISNIQNGSIINVSNYQLTIELYTGCRCYTCDD